MKLLLISYYFPPCGGAAVQRWLRFVTALTKQGHQVTAITTQDGDYPYLDDSLLAKLPPNIKILRSRPLNYSGLWRNLGQKELPYGSLESKKSDSALKRFLYWVRINLIVPDMRIGWNAGAYKLAAAELKRNSYTAVITTGPPHSTHLIGLKLKARFHITWCTDFRDPWSDIYYLKLNPPSRITMKLHKRLEKKVIQSADLNFIVSRSIAESLPEGRKEVLYNGFDKADFQDLSYQRVSMFRIKYVGQLTAGQDSSLLLDAVSELPFLSDTEISFIGTRDLPSTQLPVRITPFLPHREALNELVNAELLVLIINTYEGNKGMLTTKLFEYIASRSPILCIAAPGGEAEEIILQTKSGVVLQDKQAIMSHISTLYSLWQQGNDLRCQGDISFLDTDNQISKLSLIDKL